MINPVKTFSFEHPIPYHKKDGTATEIVSMEYRAPTFKEAHFAASIKSKFMRGFPLDQFSNKKDSEGSDKKNSDEGSMTSSDLLMLLSYNSNYEEMLEEFMKLLPKVSLFRLHEGEPVAFERDIMDNIPFEHLESIMAEYFLNFLLHTIFQKST